MYFIDNFSMNLQNQDYLGSNSINFTAQPYDLGTVTRSICRSVVAAGGGQGARGKGQGGKCLPWCRKFAFFPEIRELWEILSDRH